MIFEEIQEIRKILCLCPCCGQIYRLSDLKLRAKGPTVKTWLDEFDTKLRKINEKEQEWEEKADSLREKAHEKGRKAAAKAFNNAISPAFKKLKYDPYDIKPILNPVDFVVFKDMNKKEKVNDVVFLSKSVTNKQLNTLRDQVKKAITLKSYDWHVARIDETGNIEVE